MFCASRTLAASTPAALYIAYYSLVLSMEPDMPEVLISVNIL
jgi:hypothetical protein